MATAAVDTSVPVPAPTTDAPPASATKSAYRKNYTQKHGCRYVNYEASDEDVNTFLRRLDIIERLIELKYFTTHVIHFPWRLSTDERVITRLRNIKFNEQLNDGLVIQLWADSNSLLVAMDIMMNNWGIPVSAIRHECVVDHSSNFASAAAATDDKKEKKASAPSDADAPSSKRRRGAKGEVVEEKKTETEEAKPAKKGKRKAAAEEAAAAAAAAPAAEEKKDETQETKKRKKPVATAEEKKTAAASAITFDAMPASISPVAGRAMFRPTLEHLLVAEVNVPDNVFLKSAQSRLGYATWKATSGTTSTATTTVLEPQHPSGIRDILAGSLTVQQVPRVLEWFDSGAVDGPFSTVGVSAPGWFYLNPQCNRRKKDARVLDLVTLLVISLSKKVSGQALDASIKLVSKILSARTNDQNRETYQNKVLLLLAARFDLENPNWDSFMEAMPRYPEVRSLLGIESVTELGMNFFEALKIALADLKKDGRFLTKKQKRKRGAVVPELDENGNPIPAKERPPSGFCKPRDVSDELCAFLGIASGTQIARTQVITKVYEYIRENNLQIQEEKQYIMPDEKFGALLGTREKVAYFHIARLLEKHYPKTQQQNGAEETKA